LEALEREEVIAGREREGLAIEVRLRQPDTTEDAVVLVERIQQTGGPLAAEVLDGEGVVADQDQRLGNAGALEVRQNGPQQVVAAQIEEHLVLTVGVILHAGAAPRGRDESLHPLPSSRLGLPMPLSDGSGVRRAES